MAMTGEDVVSLAGRLGAAGAAVQRTRAGKDSAFIAFELDGEAASVDVFWDDDGHVANVNVAGELHRIVVSSLLASDVVSIVREASAR